MLPLTRSRNRSRFFGIPFSPSSLFAAGEQGAWYDPSDYGSGGTGGVGTLFQDSAGTTPVTAVEQFVGLMLDKSKGLVLGSELVDTMNTAAAWAGYGANTVVNEDGGVKITYVDNSAGARTFFAATDGLTQNLIVGAQYAVTGEAKVNAGSSVNIQVNAPGATVYKTVTSTTYEQFSFRFIASDPTSNLLATTGMGTGEIIWLRNFSVKQVAGNHAFQTTSAKRPKLAARYNLLTRTEEFDDGVWLKSNLNTTGTPAWVNVAVAPDGTTTADKFIANVGTFRVDAANTTPVVVAQYSQTIYAQKDTYQYLWIGDRGDAAGIRSATFDLNSGTVLGQSNGTASIFDAGNGWWKCVLLYSRANAGNASAMYALGDSSHTIDRPSKTWLGTEALNVWGADLRPASQATGLIGPTYQRVAAATVYDTAGFLPYLAFDGLSWSMGTNSIAPGAIDKAQVFAGVRKLSDAAQAAVAEFSATIASNNGTFLLAAPDGATQTYGFDSKGTTQVDAVASSLAAPRTNVVTGLADIAGDSCVIRVDGAVADTETGDQGTGNFLTYPLFIGGRNNASLFFNGWLSALIVRFGANLSQSQIEATEAWVNGKTGAY